MPTTDGPDNIEDSEAMSVDGEDATDVESPVAETDQDTQERSDAAAATVEETEEAPLPNINDEDDIAADEPAEEAVEGYPESETETPTDDASDDSSHPVEFVTPTVEDNADVTTESDDSDAAEEDAEAEGGVGSTAEAAPARRKSGYERGDIIEVTVQDVSDTAVKVELDERGEGFEGIIPGRELDRMGDDMKAMLVPGESLQLYVVNNGNNNGEVILSLNRALEELDWRQAEEYRQSREIYDGKIAGYNKGGLIVRFGRLRGFVPQSQISDERRARAEGNDGADTPEGRWSAMVKEPIRVKVIEVDRDRNRLIISERAAARETREERKAALIEELTLNEVRRGRVVSLEDFGAFVDVGGAEGLVHLTELSWGHVTHPKQVLEIGEEINVEVINIDTQRKRIGLSLKRQLPDPWDIVASNYQRGQLVKATVTKLTKFGAFAQLEKQPDIEGLIHISELSEERVEHPRDVVDVNDELTLRIVKIDIADRRLGLSLKAVNSTEYLDSDMDFLYGE